MLAVQPDRVLCTLALRGNAAAFEVLYSRYHSSIYAFIYHLLGRGANAEDAEDLAQDTFGSAFDKLHARREGGSFRAWLYTIARNRTFDHIKSDKSSASDELQNSLEADAAASVELNAEQRAQMLWLVAALHELPERQRQALVMRELGGMSYDEIAASIDATVPSVKQLINRARGTVTDAAAVAGYSPKHLDRSLQAIAPLIPVAASSATLAAFGIGGGGSTAAAGVGGFSAAAKIATVAATVAVVGGSAAGVTDIAHHAPPVGGKIGSVILNSRHAGHAGGATENAQTLGPPISWTNGQFNAGGSGARQFGVYFNLPVERGGAYLQTNVDIPIGNVVPGQSPDHGAHPLSAPGDGSGDGGGDNGSRSPRRDSGSGDNSQGPSAESDGGKSVDPPPAASGPPDYSHAIPQAQSDDSGCTGVAGTPTDATGATAEAGPTGPADDGSNAEPSSGQ
jgi:RNA polymerase sigma factor (sigma-70 family)